MNTMNRRFFHSSITSFGRPFKKRNSVPVLHAAHRPMEKADIDFNLLDLTFKMKEIPKFVVAKHAWSPKPIEEPNLPFYIERTEIGLALPVYTDFKAGNTKVITILRKIKGDVNILKSEIEKVVGKEVEVRPGKIIVVGNFHRRLKVWLTGLGF